jgi:hypothetical protein
MWGGLSTPVLFERDQFAIELLDIGNVLYRAEIEEEERVSFWMMAPEWASENGTRPYYTLFIQFDAGCWTDEAQLQSVVREIDETRNSLDWLKAYGAMSRTSIAALLLMFLTNRVNVTVV